jgi:hypothetical protein
MIKKDKIFELKIEEDDDISGIDSISLVDDPAIEVNWVAFNKHKEDFYIPDGEDEKYLSLIMDKSEAEEDLLNDGWEVASVRVLGEESFFGTEPNEPSAQDTEEYRVRYKYILNPNISQSAIIPTTRQFCRTILNQNRVWRIEDMDAVFNEFSQPATLWRGGYNCRHRWAEIRYKRDSKIINKASVKTGVESESVPQQPTTYTDKTINNPSPSTIRNLGLSKQKMEITPSNVNVFGYHTRYFEICPGAQELFKHLISMEMDEDTIGMVRSAAQVADNIFRLEYEIIKSGIATKHQYEEAVLLVEDFKDIMYEIDQLVGMSHNVDFMDNHIIKIKEYLKDDMGYDVGTIGGYVDPGVKKKKKMGVSIIVCRECGHKWEMKDGGDKPYMCNKCGYDNPVISKGLVEPSMFGNSNDSQMSKQYFQIDNEEKRIVLGPAMIPDMKIFRKDAMGNPYYVFFSAETIRMIAEKYMKNQYTRNNDLMHDGKAISDIYVVESWIKEDDADKSTKYGYGDLPISTWFISMKIPKTPKGDEVWNQVKEKN